MKVPQVVLGSKAQAFRASRKLTRQIENITSWVEDALDTVVEVTVVGEEPVSDYLRWEYPESLARRRRGQDDKRRTLQWRLSFMLRYLCRCRQEYLRLQRWQFAGLEGMLNIFSSALRQALGDVDCVDAFDRFLNRLRQVWDEGDCPWANADEMGEAIETLRNELPTLFERLQDAFRAREQAAAEAGQVTERLDVVVDKLDKLGEGQTATQKLVRKSLRICEGVVGCGESPDEDVYSREAGLDAYPGARGREIRQAIALSHERFPVVLKPKHGEPSLRKLAKTCWDENAEEFGKFTALPVQPGFKNWQCLSTALYDLARKYPQADHFSYVVAASAR